MFFKSRCIVQRLFSVLTGRGSGIALDQGGDGMKNGKIRVRWRSVLLGIGMGTLILVCGSAAGAAMMAGGVVDVAHMGLLAAGILVLSAVLGGMTALLGQGSGMDAALTGLGELVVLMVLNLALCDGKMEGIGVTILVLAGGCGAAALLRVGGGRRKPARHRRRNR